MHHFIAINEFKLELQSGNARFWSKRMFFQPCDLQIWQTTLKNNRTLLLSNIKIFHHFIVICEFKLELQSGKDLVGFWPLWPWPVTLTFCVDTTLVNGNNSWKFSDDTMTGTLQKRWNRRTDRRTSVLHIWNKYQVKLDAPHSAQTYSCSHFLAVTDGLKCS